MGTLFWLQGGGGCGCGSWFFCVVVHLWSLLPAPAVFPFGAAPPPFFCSVSLPVVLVVSASPSLVVCLFPGRGLCRRVRGVLSSGLSVATLPWQSAFSGWVSSGWAGWCLSVLSVGPVVVARGVASLAGLPASLEWVRGFAAVWLSLLYSLAPPGWRVVQGGSPFAFFWLFPVRMWVGFTHFPVAFFCGGGFVCSSLCQPWAGTCTGQ